MITVVSSSLPDEWKEKASKILIEKGVDIDATNVNGDTAMDVAKREGNTGLIELLSAQALLSVQDKPPINPMEQCGEAIQGTLNMDLVDYSDPSHNAYLFDCAVAVTAPPLSLVSGKNVSGEDKAVAQRKTEKENKRKIADFFLSKEIDVDFRNAYGSTLLMDLVISFFSDEWKEKAARTLVEKGVDIDTRNVFGYTAMDLVKSGVNGGNTGIIELLSAQE